jgi:hypothetical protein
MPKYPIIQSDRSYTFADYFQLNFAPRDILAYFNVTLERQAMTLPRSVESLDRLVDLKRRIDEPIISGAVSTGSIWQFGIFNRHTRQIHQDLNLYRVPADLEDLLRILVGILGH